MIRNEIEFTEEEMKIIMPAIIGKLKLKGYSFGEGKETTIFVSPSTLKNILKKEQRKKWWKNALNFISKVIYRGE